MHCWVVIAQGSDAGGFGSPLTPGSKTASINELYDTALKQSKGDVHLLRLISRTGPAWAELQEETAIQLLKVFVNNVKVSGCLVQLRCTAHLDSNIVLWLHSTYSIFCCVAFDKD
jgi:hypothetical protein